MGVVHLARQRATGRPVALKMLKSAARAGWEEVTRFRAEAEVVARLQHPNIVQIYEVGEQDGQPFFAMEYVEGGSLFRHTAGRAQPARQAAQMVETLARAMHVAHQHGIVHRDLKPANVLLTEDGTPKITDFGLAKQMDRTTRMTQTGEVLGTPNYMAPEQATGAIRAIGPATDVYALGAMLYELLTGRPPFEAETAVETVRQVAFEDPVPPCRLQPSVPRALETICLTCLEKEPRRRYVSAEALADDLLRFCAGERTRARPLTPLQRVLRWAKRHPAAAALVLVSGLAVLGLLAVSLSYNVALREKARLAEERRNEAQRQWERAEMYFQRARAAVQQLTELGQEGLADIPQLEPLRRDLLENALAFHRRFLAEQGTDEAVRQETGTAYRNVGDIQKMLGQYAEARQAYEQAITLFTQLANGFGNNLSHQRDLAASQFALGSLALRFQGQPQAAEKPLREAVALQEQLAADASHKPTHQQALARTHNELGEVLKQTNRAAEAEPAYRAAIQIQAQLVEEQPDEPEYRSDLAGSYNDLGVLLRSLSLRPGRPPAEVAALRQQAEESFLQALGQFRTLTEAVPRKAEYRQKYAAAFNNLGLVRWDAERFPEADEANHKALGLRQQLAVDYPSVPRYRHELANSHNLVASVLQRLKKTAEAEKEFTQAVVIEQKLVDEFPAVPDYQSALGGMLDNLANLLRAGGRLPGARERLHEALPHHEAARRANPEHPTYRQFLRNHYIVLAETSLNQGDHREATKAAAELPRLFPERWEECRLAAVILARCASRAQKNAPPAEGSAKLSLEYAGQAVQMLREAVRRGYQNVSQIKTSADFEPLRGHAEFQKVVSELEERARVRGP
jgi:tetratricopeptide (TPR) repeat protein/predicted Ser/Thr protein kinase